MTKETMIVETISGKLVNLNNFAPHEILLSDVVQGLSLVNRFNGRFARIEEPLNLFCQGMLGSSNISVRGESVTVLQHSYAMYLFAKHKYWNYPQLAIECLLHDAPEAYTGDIISPLKAHIPMLHDIEQRIFNALSTVYGLPLPDSEAVKELDALALRIEWETFVARGGELDEYKTRAAHYGERAADADAMDDVAMRRALYEARSYTPAQLADKVLLILYTEIVYDVRNKVEAQVQSVSADADVSEPTHLPLTTLRALKPGESVEYVFKDDAAFTKFKDTIPPLLPYLEISSMPDHKTFGVRAMIRRKPF